MRTWPTTTRIGRRGSGCGRPGAGRTFPTYPGCAATPRTVGRVFTTADGKQYRPSMFLTATLPSYGAVLADGAPRNPAHCDYRRAALDALHFSKLCGRLWANLRRCAGFNVQYFSAIEAQHRLAPHLHAAIRGAIPRAILRQVVEATYYTLWWPPFDEPVYVGRAPVWTGTDYVNPDTGEVLPTWQQALDALDADQDAQPPHVLRFGRQLDLQGVIPEHADRAIRYLTKYLTKAIGKTHTDPDSLNAAYEQHIDRMHVELRFLPCSPRCANWLRYGVQPDHPGPGLVPGQCRGRAHDRENLGINRRVLPSRKWSGKTVAQHKADRAEVVRQTLVSAGMDDLDLDRLAASVTMPDGSPRFVWTDTRPDHDTYIKVILHSVAERQRWSAHDAAKATVAAAAKPVDSVSTIAQPP
jgi:Replication initiator protein, pSAM2